MEKPEPPLLSLSTLSLSSLSVCCILPSAPIRELLFLAPLLRCPLWLLVKSESELQYCGALLSVGTPSCQVWRKSLRQIRHSEISGPDSDEERTSQQLKRGPDDQSISDRFCALRCRHSCRPTKLSCGRAMDSMLAETTAQRKSLHRARIAQT